MSAIAAFLNGAVFEPQDIRAMSMALDDVCKALKINGDGSAKEVIAIRIIELARRGERSPTKLRVERVVSRSGVRTAAEESSAWNGMTCRMTI